MTCNYFPHVDCLYIKNLQSSNCWLCFFMYNKEWIVFPAEALFTNFPQTKRFQIPKTDIRLTAFWFCSIYYQRRGKAGNVGRKQEVNENQGERGRGGAEDHSAVIQREINANEWIGVKRGDKETSGLRECCCKCKCFCVCVSPETDKDVWYQGWTADSARCSKHRFPPPLGSGLN